MTYRPYFRAVGYPVRLYSGKDALSNLPAEVARRGAKRAFVVCGRTVSKKTPLVPRIRELLGASFAGVYDELAKDAPLAAVLGARDAARAAQADLLIAVGAGSVVQATRVVAILLAETSPVEELITQYPENAPAVSPKLMAPKLPIVNVLTSATSAQNRAGSAVKGEGLDHRMEFFDPKTRPVAVFWDSDALLTAPLSLVRTSAASVYWRAVMNMGAESMTPLVEGDRLQALRLAEGALARIAETGDAAPRIELCAAAFLQNRDADDGGGMADRHWVGRAVYAFAAALFNQHEHVTQGQANAALTPGIIRKLGARDPEAMCRIGKAMNVWHAGEPVERAPERAANALARKFESLGMPVRLAHLDVPRESLQKVLEHSLKNFNADPKREFIRERDMLWDALQSTWCEEMDQLTVGMKDTLEWEVTERLATARGEFKVFSTPSMCLLAEMASHKLAAPYLKEGQGQVGVTVNIRHMAATPLGRMVRAETKLLEVDRRRLKFPVMIYDDVEQVGEVTHERFVIDVDKYTERLRKKIAG